MIRNCHYAKAEEIINKSIATLKGRNYYKAILMLANISTSSEKSEKCYMDIINNGTPREALVARVELAKIYYSRDEYSEVLGLLGTLPAKNPSSYYYEALFFKGISYKQLGMVSEARSSFKLIDRGKYLYPGILALAELDMQEGRIENAIERLETIAAEYYDPSAGFKLGECYEIKGDKKKALKIYRTLLTKFPRSLEAPRAKEKVLQLSMPVNEMQKREELPKEAKNIEISPEGKIENAKTQYTVQFGAFSEKTNALRLKKELSSLGLKVWVEEFQLGDMLIYRVRAGRYADRDEAEKKAKEFQNKLGLNCRVLPLNNR